MYKSCSTCNKKLILGEACESCGDEKSMWGFEGETSQSIVYIDIDKLFSHPKNPRKQLKELDELQASIAENGIMQNLTVVPWYSMYTGKPGDNGSSDGDYYVVIGHRRRAAAKLAGLTKIPCIITDMDEKQQVATMLMENMQRSDLTIIEEAEGMQMCFDLGSTPEEISQKTGLSKATIKRRGQLLELDRDKLYQSYERGGTLQNYMELNKIKDSVVKNKVLETIGTENFNWELKKAIREEKEKILLKAIIQELEGFAEKIEISDDKTHLKYVTCLYSNELKKPEDFETRKYYYALRDGYINLYTDRDEDELTEMDPGEEKRKELQNKINGIHEGMYELRSDFVNNFTPKAAKDHGDIIVRSAIEIEIREFGWNRGKDILERLEIDGLNSEKYKQKISEMPEKILFVTVMTKIDSAYKKYNDWKDKYCKDDELDFIYDLLCQLGYEMSDEELAMQNGTHEVFNLIEANHE